MGWLTATTQDQDQNVYERLVLDPEEAKLFIHRGDSDACMPLIEGET